MMDGRNMIEDSGTVSEVVLLLNVGSPDSPEVQDVARYLRQFLSDKRIITLPAPFRQMLVYGLIVPLRKKSSAAKYRLIWDEDNHSFPLISYTHAVASALKNPEREVLVAMRYGHPTVAEALAMIPDPSRIRLTVFPLYPHYAMSSYETAVEHCKKEIKRLCPRLPYRIIPPFYAHEAYIRSLVESIRPYLHQPFDKLIFSYHGIPYGHLDKTTRSTLGLPHPEGCCTEADPTASVCYLYQTRKTTELVSKALGLQEKHVEYVFQSRFGHAEWVRPYLSDRIVQWPEEGIKRILVICPTFVCDCLETLEEIALTARQDFLAAGGVSFTYIPCLNSESHWVEGLNRMLKE